MRRQQNTPSGRPKNAKIGRLSTDNIFDAVALRQAMDYHDIATILGYKSSVAAQYADFVQFYRECPGVRKSYIQHQKAVQRSKKLYDHSRRRPSGRVVQLHDS